MAISRNTPIAKKIKNSAPYFCTLYGWLLKSDFAKFWTVSYPYGKIGSNENNVQSSKFLACNSLTAKRKTLYNRVQDRDNSFLKGSFLSMNCLKWISNEFWDFQFSHQVIYFMIICIKIVCFYFWNVVTWMACKFNLTTSRNYVYQDTQ